MAAKNTIKAHTMTVKRELSCLETKRKFKNIKEDKYKQIRSSRQIDKLEQWIMNRAVKDEVLGSILGSNKKSFFEPLIVSVLLIKHLSLFHYKQFTIKRKTRLSKYTPIKQYKA